MILDSNALSAFLDNTASAVAIVSRASRIASPVIVAGEFAYGIAQSRHRKAYEQSLERMLDRSIVLDVNRETVRHYAAIRLELKAAGTPIPANDVWIAALSRQHAMAVMSRDAHFDLVWGLRRQTW